MTPGNNDKVHVVQTAIACAKEGATLAHALREREQRGGGPRTGSCGPRSKGMVMRSPRLRPSLSSFHTMSVSPGRKVRRHRARAGRFVVAPVSPLSSKM